MVSTLREKFNNSNKVLFLLKAVFSVLTIYFALRVIYVSTSALLGYTNPSGDPQQSLLFWMLLSLGLSNTVEVIDMFLAGKKKYFGLLVVSTIFTLGVAMFILFI